MWKSTLFMAKAAIVVAALAFAFEQPSFAQRGGRGGGRGGGIARGGAVVRGGAVRGGVVRGGVVRGGVVRGGVVGGGVYRGGYYGGGLGRYGYGYGNGRYGWWPGFGLYLGGYWPGWYGGYYGDYGPGFYGSPSYYSSPYYYDSAAGGVPDTGYQGYYPPIDMSDNSAMVEVLVPPDAKVWFNDTLTRQSGQDRIFTTPPLEPGKTFSYQIRAEWTVNGAPTSETRQVQVQAGRRSLVDFITMVPEIKK